MSEFTALNLTFLDDEDRLALDLLGGAEPVRLICTRRMVRRLIPGIATLLSQSSAAKARAPYDMQREVLIIEHLSAKQVAETAPTADPAGKVQAVPPLAPSQQGLLCKLEVETHPAFFRLVFSTTDGRHSTVQLGRTELHRLLGSLHAMAGRAEWNLEMEAGWLVAADPAMSGPAVEAS